MAVIYDCVLGDIRMGVAASGGGAAAEIVSGGSVGYIPVLSGGECYRFTEPLTSLGIGSITSSLEESDVLFTAGAVVSPPAEIRVRYRTGESYEWVDDDEGGHDEFIPEYSDFTLVSSGGGYFCAVGSRAWEDISDAEDEDAYHSYLSGGSFTCVSSGGKWVISAHGITQFTSDTTTEWVEGEEDPETGEMISEGELTTSTVTSSRSIDGLVASSADLGTWTINPGVTVRCLYWNDWDCMTDGGDASADGIIATPIVTPCDVALPSGALLVNSSSFSVESGHRYEMNVRHGAIVVGEWMERVE